MNTSPNFNSCHLNRSCNRISKITHILMIYARSSICPTRERLCRIINMINFDVIYQMAHLCMQMLFTPVYYSLSLNRKFKFVVYVKDIISIKHVNHYHNQFSSKTYEWHLLFIYPLCNSDGVSLSIFPCFRHPRIHVFT